MPALGDTWARWLLAFFVVVLCLIGGELFLRHWFPLNGVLLRRDARYLYSYIPGARSRTKYYRPAGYPPGDTVLTAINKQGRRGALLSNGPSDLRVVVYGDSYIAAEYTPLQNTFVYQLEQLLKARLSEKVEVANAGVPGYGPDQESLVFEDQVDTLRPALVIFAMCSVNDFGDLIRNKLFALDVNNRLVRRPAPALDTALNQYFDEAEALPRLQLVRRLLSSTQRLGTLLHLQPNTPKTAPQRPFASDDVLSLSSTDLIRRWIVNRETEYRTLVEDRDSLVHNLFSDTYDADMSTHPNAPSSRYKKILMARMMERIHNIAASRSVPLLFLLIPAPIDVDDSDFTVDLTVFPEYRRSELTDAFESIAKDLHRPYLNLFAPFSEHRRDALHFRIKTDHNDHWNTAGQRLAATLMADYILRNHLLGSQALH